LDITIKISQIRLINRKEFVNRVIEHSIEKPSYKEAYEAAEKEFRVIYGRSRYSSYESFRVAKHREQNPEKKSNQLTFSF